MRACRAVILLASMPGFLQAQPGAIDSSVISVVPPGIVTRMEKFDPPSPSRRVGLLRFTTDRQGFLWCATNEGLARFDGHELKLFGEDPTDTVRAIRTQMQAIAGDSDGFVWAATFNAGLKRLDPATGHSRWYSGRLDDSTSIGPGAYRLLVTSDGQLWAAAGYGLARYNRESDSFVRYNLPPEYQITGDYPITTLCENGRSIWAGVVQAGSVGGGVLEYNRDSGVWKRYLHDSSTGTGPTENGIRAICPDRSGRLWIGTRAGLDRYDPQADTWHHFSVSKNGITESRQGTFPARSTRIWTIVPDGFGGIWLGTDGIGIFRIDPATGDFRHFRHDKTDKNSLQYDLVIFMYAPGVRHEQELSSNQAPPASSIIWIPWGAEGAQKIIVRRDPCVSVMMHREEGRIKPLVNGFVRGSTGKLWVSVLNGFVGLFDLQTSQARWYPEPRGGIDQLDQLRDGTPVVTTRSPGAWMLDRQHDAFVPLARTLNITSFLEENDSLLWLGCRNDAGMSYVAAFNRRTGGTTVYPRQDPDSARYLDGMVRRMCKDGRGGMWYGTTSGGLIRFDLKQKTYRRIAADPASVNGLASNNVSVLVTDSVGKLWVGTDAGLGLMDCERGVFEHMHSGPERDRELSISDIVDDGNGHLWITSSEHVVCFTKAARTFRRLIPPDRFPPLFGGEMFEPRSRTLTIGGVSGFFSFSIDDPPTGPPPAPVVLTSFKVFDKPFPLDADIWALRSITIPYSARFFSFTFAALDHSTPEKNEYMYRLEGFDPEWIWAGSRRYASYTNLDPGTYLFRVRASNSEGIWNREGASIRIIVKPPWYRTVWAFLVWFLLAGILLYSLYAYDRKRTALKHSLEVRDLEARKTHELDQMKSRFFANISHEFRTPLTLILGPLEQPAALLRNDEHARSTFAMIRRNALRLLQLVNQLLDLSRMDAGKMSVQVCPLDLVKLTRPLVMSFLSQAERKKIRLIFDPEEDEIVGYNDPDKVEKILANLLSNAFKFTDEGGEIKVIVRLKNPPGPRTAEILVADSGIGIKPEDLPKIFDRFYQADSQPAREHGGTGIGLALTKDLAEILRGNIEVQSTPGRGTTFTVRLPIGKEHWSASEIVTDEMIRTPSALDSEAVELDEGGAADEQTDAEGGTGKPVLLIVEDNPEVRAYLRGILKDGYRIVEAQNGREALEKARDAMVDLVISDIMMPVMDGVQLCRELKTDDRTSHIPVILLTARALEEDRLQGLGVGADDYIVKPFDARELIARATNLIDLRRKLREKYQRQVVLAPREIPVTSPDERFLKKLTQNIEAHLTDANYDTEKVAYDMCMSRMQLNRKLQALTGHSPHELVREFRLERAAELLRKHAGNVTEVAFEVGFNSLSHFARAFRERFGSAPSEYIKNRPGECSGPEPASHE